jgi:hypothetical protein
MLRTPVARFKPETHKYSTGIVVPSPSQCRGQPSSKIAVIGGSTKHARFFLRTTLETARTTTRQVDPYFETSPRSIRPSHCCVVSRALRDEPLAFAQGKKYMLWLSFHKTSLFPQRHQKSLIGFPFAISDP